MIIVPNPPSFRFIPLELNSVLQDIVVHYQQVLNSRLVSVYLFGSAGRGEYQAGVSDIDIVAIVDHKTSEDQARIRKIQAQLGEKYHFQKLDLDVYDLAKLDKKAWLQFYLLSDGLCLWGTEYRPTYPLPAERSELAYLLASFLLERHDRIHEILSGIRSIQKDLNPEVRRQIYSNFAKSAIRLANVIVIMRTGICVHNMGEIINLIAESVPEIAELTNQVNIYRLVPPDDFADFLTLLRKADLIRDFVECHGYRKNNMPVARWPLKLCLSVRHVLGLGRYIRWYVRYYDRFK